MGGLCPICFDDLTDKVKATPNACDHVFCISCLEKWSKLGSFCPIDRKRYRKIINLNSETALEVKPQKRKRTRILYDFSTICDICQKDNLPDTLLLCDCCDLGFHCQCLSPPLEFVPAGPWFCPTCVSVEKRLKEQKGITKEVEANSEYYSVKRKPHESLTDSTDTENSEDVGNNKGFSSYQEAQTDQAHGKTKDTTNEASENALFPTTPKKINLEKSTSTPCNDQEIQKIMKCQPVVLLKKITILDFVDSKKSQIENCLSTSNKTVNKFDVGTSNNKPTTSSSSSSDGFDTNISLQNCERCNGITFRNSESGGAFCKICKIIISKESPFKKVSHSDFITNDFDNLKQNLKIRKDGSFYLDIPKSSPQSTESSRANEGTPLFTFGDLRQRLKIQKDGTFFLDSAQAAPPVSIKPKPSVQKQNVSFDFGDLKHHLKIRNDGSFYLDWAV